MTDSISKEKLAELKETFTLFDKDNDGSISIAELDAALKAAGQSPNLKDLQETIRQADADGDGRVDFEEFVVMMTTGEQLATNDPELSQEERLTKTFKSFDLDGDGYITRDELQIVMESLGEDLTDIEITEMMREADHNKDGKIELHEFIKAFGKSA
ncbi:hypothetical protein H4R33_000535 [Dimargaris cristalligena]|uniref:EF-hand domain-containing protein n=1 Tax=Dimargaris cristalligena TaxID=215637 RepID=A0A4P9ZPZ1_9FUNG|nr:hypothetical protein H4R33_000535 [Dimargaris cristalligena]RKP35268.1 hypothetical protein BJ085DRAFT_28417 [Dimargaris cristalligena]|eukprot:RKP35268.1 hypothetical protein BJ085DRAFT_28417 [Dimargaris cristalligena]